MSKQPHPTSGAFFHAITFNDELVIRIKLPGSLVTANYSRDELEQDAALGMEDATLALRRFYWRKPFAVS